MGGIDGLFTLQTTNAHAAAIWRKYLLTRGNDLAGTFPPHRRTATMMIIWREGHAPVLMRTRCMMHASLCIQQHSTEEEIVEQVHARPDNK